MFYKPKILLKVGKKRPGLQNVSRYVLIAFLLADLEWYLMHRHHAGIDFDDSTKCDIKGCTDGDGNRMEALDCVCLRFRPSCPLHSRGTTHNGMLCSPWTSPS